MSNFDKLIDVIVKKNGTCDSSTLNSCSVRVNDNPLYSDCIVDGRLVSDLELALVDKNQSLLDLLENTIRSPKFADSGSRHVSAAELFNSLSDIDDSIAALKDSAAQPAAQSAEQPASQSASQSTSTPSPVAG